MTLEFAPSALQTYLSYKLSRPELASKIKLLVADIMQTPFSGMGQPVRLEGKLSSKWVRNIDYELFMVYSATAYTIRVLFIGQPNTQTQPETGNTDSPTLEEFSKDDFKSVMEIMSANRGHDSEPKVGLFWYNRANKSLFGVVSHRISDYSRANAWEGRITCSEMHEDVWKREFHKQKYHNGGAGPFVGAYQDKPRGRIFYNVNRDIYEIAVGKWVEDCPEAFDVIVEEFNLPKDKAVLKYASHWDIGQTWA